MEYLARDNQTTITWHVGESSPIDDLGSTLDTNNIVSVRADGAELDYLEHYYPSLPFMVGNKVQRWYGDHAKFIVGNLT